MEFSGACVTAVFRPSQWPDGDKAQCLTADPFPTQEPQHCVVVGGGYHIEELERDGGRHRERDGEKERGTENKTN